MKLLSIIVCGFLFAISAQANELERKVVLLGNLAYGMEAHKVKGRTAEEMIINLGVKVKGEGRDEFLKEFHRNLPAKDISFGDMIGWGTMRLPAAIALFESMDVKRDRDGNDLTERHEKNLKLAAQVLKELAAIGADFGFTDHSSSYCGVTFMGLLVVDVENGVVYEVSLTSSGEC